MEQKTPKFETENSKKLKLCIVLVFHKGIFYSKKDVFNWDYDSSKFYKLLYSKKEKGSSSFFSEDFFFFSSTFLWVYFIGFFCRIFVFLVLLAFCVSLDLQLSCSLFFGTSGSKTKTLFLFLLLVLFFGYFFFFLVSCSLLVKKNCGVWQIFFVVVEGFFGVVLGSSSRIRNFSFGEFDSIFFFGHFFCLDFGCTIVIPSF